MSSQPNEVDFGAVYNIHRAIHELLNWIEMNIHQPLSVNDIVRRSGYSTFYLQHMFKSVTGEPVARYIRRRKLGLAVCLLRENDVRISDVAFGLGFEDVSTFYRSFRREFGFSPGEYRRRLI
ncbi:helix-turn-helix domain-containing protein [Enterobacter kobei]|uniref:helix-turn-helix domain-containing protein n=1 Tax=Enterobacter kobei TaxID=208224 RepID=UPI00092D1A83|nr:AraC family transcriptional regulator [Enterobacter kobei]